MWVVVKPLLKNEDLGLLTSSIDVEDEMQNGRATVFRLRILKEVIRKAAPASISQISTKAESVAINWSLFIVNKIIANSKKKPVYQDVPSKKKKLVEGKDMEWAINNLPKEAFLNALCSCFWDIYRFQKKTSAKATSTHQACLPFLTELGDDCVRKSEECWESSIVDNSQSFRISCKGKLVLVNWVSEILTRATTIAGKVRLGHGMKRITAVDMLLGLNWARLNLVLGTPFSFRGQEKNNKKRKRTEDHTAMSVYNYDSTINSYLPRDLLENNIFPNLPLRSLQRFNCVCKEWREIISSSYLRYFHHAQQDHTTISIAIFSDAHKAMYQDIISECDGLDIFKVDAVSNNDESIQYYGSCCGLLCFAIAIGGTRWRFTVGNPVTKEWHLLPPAIFDVSIYFDHIPCGPGLAVDTSTNPPSYKLVVPSFGMQSASFQVFSSETWQWKAMDIKTDPKIDIAGSIRNCKQCCSVYIDGVLYYFAGSTDGVKLIWLDLGSEMIGIIPFPCKQIYKYCALGSLESMKGRKRLTCCVNAGGERVEVYVLLEKNEWEILLSIKAGVSCGRVFEPCPYYGGEIVVVGDGREFIYAYNLRSKHWKWIGSDKNGISRSKSFPYKMSLLSLPKVKTCLDVEEKKTKRFGKES